MAGITKTMRDNARTYYFNNREMNSLKTLATNARKMLFVEMKARGIKSFPLTSENASGAKLQLDVSLETPSKKVVDVNKLKELVSDNMFMSIISASQEKVKEIAGKAVLDQCLMEADGEECATVKERKG